MNQKQWNQYAEHYHEYVISPLRDGVDNPLGEDLKKIANAATLTVADLGCGRGELLPTLAAQFRKVYAIDFSPKMLEIARERNRGVRNLSFLQRDLRELTGVHVDVAIAINSVLHPHFEDCNSALVAIHAAIAPGGYFFGIFPSTEALLHSFQLIYEREYAKYKDERKALQMARRIAERNKYIFMNGVYDDDGERQKLFTQTELQRTLERTGFTHIEFAKVRYPWEKVGDYEKFPGEPELWDWYVRARKD